MVEGGGADRGAAKPGLCRADRLLLLGADELGESVARSKRDRAGRGRIHRCSRDPNGAVRRYLPTIVAYIGAGGPSYWRTVRRRRSSSTRPVDSFRLK